jgi:hypothetical protein
MASDLSSKIEQFLSKPSATTWDNVPISENPELVTFFRDQMTAVVDRQCNTTTLQKASIYLRSTIECLERIPDADQIALERIRLFKQQVELRLEILREEESEKEAASVKVPEGSIAVKFLVLGLLGLGALGAYLWAGPKSGGSSITVPNTLLS